jgi:RING finger protein 113A
MADAEEAAQKAAADAAAAVPVGFAKRKNRGNMRKRAAAEGEGEEEQDDGTQVVRKAKQQRGEPLAFTTKKEDREEVLFKYEGTRALPKQRDDLATRALNTETEFDRDGRALREKVLQQAQADGGFVDDGQYRGMNSYIDFRQGFRRESTIASEKGAGAHGPLRANVYVRSSARFDYQPDLCKDYKETGFCSYGDSCKFMHDRGDYKSGWELEREWEEEQKRKREALLKGWDPDKGDADEEEEEEEDELPIACWACRKPWEECKDPVVTRCKHYFCEKCALAGSTKGGGRCGVCNEPTKGIFNVAHDIIKRMKKQQEQQGQAQGQAQAQAQGREEEQQQSDGES